MSSEVAKERNPEALYVLQVRQGDEWWTQVNYSWTGDEEGRLAAQRKADASVFDARVIRLVPDAEVDRLREALKARFEDGVPHEPREIAKERDRLRVTLGKVAGAHQEAYPGAGWCAGCHDAARNEDWPCPTTNILAADPVSLADDGSAS